MGTMLELFFYLSITMATETSSVVLKRFTSDIIVFVCMNFKASDYISEKRVERFGNFIFSSNYFFLFK